MNTISTVFAVAGASVLATYVQPSALNGLHIVYNPTLIISLVAACCGLCFCATRRPSDKRKHLSVSVPRGCPDLDGKRHAASTRPRTDQFFVNRRGSRLHVRLDLPNSEANSLVYLVHGLAAHCNREGLCIISKRFNELGVGVVMLDLEGHGFSGPEGHPDDTRVAIDDHNHLVDDLELLIRYISDSSESARADIARAEAEGTANLVDRAMAMRLTQVPFFVMGQSLGGALTLLLSLRLQSSLQTPNRHLNYCGSILLAPAIKGSSLPHPIVVWILTKVCARLWPRRSMPEVLNSTAIPENNWTDPKVAEAISLDVLDKGGLVWEGGIRFGTAAALLNMSIHAVHSVCDVEFPFLAIHDPDDKVCAFAGSELLYHKSKTPAKHKSILKVPGYRHDLLMNMGRQAVDHAWNFMQEQMRAI